MMIAKSKDLPRSAHFVNASDPSANVVYRGAHTFKLLHICLFYSEEHRAAQSGGALSAIGLEAL